MIRNSIIVGLLKNYRNVGPLESNVGPAFAGCGPAFDLKLCKWHLDRWSLRQSVTETNRHWDITEFLDNPSLKKYFLDNP